MRETASTLASIVGALALSLAMPSLASAQEEGFGVGYADVGPVVGLDDGPVLIGGRVEMGFKDIGGNGVLGLVIAGGRVHFSQPDYSDGITYLPMVVAATYHFRLANRKIDPFLGLGLGYEQTRESSFTFNRVVYLASTRSRTTIELEAGVRYFFRPKMAALVSLSMDEILVGVMFKVGGA